MPLRNAAACDVPFAMPDSEKDNVSRARKTKAIASVDSNRFMFVVFESSGSVIRRSGSLLSKLRYDGGEEIMGKAAKL